jgi:exopolysaccharide/PEP-CTERM locus tyrosine autokinase
VSLVEKALQKMASTRVPAAAAAPARRSTDAVAGADSVTRTATVAAVVPQEQGLTRADKVLAIDLTALRNEGLLPEENEQRRFTSEYRQIKRPLLAAARGRGVPPLPNGRLIMVASALPGEGKTFTSINLAMTLALEKDTTVLLVDGDVAKAHLSRAFGMFGEPGLTDLLLEETADVASVILPTSIPGVSVLPAGRDAEHATELLSSARMELLLAEMLRRDPSRIVLFDSSPLLLTTESRALAGVVGQIVLVVRAEGTTHKAVVDALKCLGENKPVGLVLNQCQSSPTHVYYGYGEYGDSAEPRRP